MEEKTVKCKRCKTDGLFWRQSKKGNWYLAVVNEWVGDMGGTKIWFSAHKCETYIKVNEKRISELKIEVAELQELITYLIANPESTIPGYLQKQQDRLVMKEAELSRLSA